MTCQESMERIVKIDQIIERGVSMPVVSLVNYKSLKSERKFLVTSLLNYKPKGGHA